VDRVALKRAWGRLLVAARLRDPFRQAMVSGDVVMLQRIWSKVTGLPAPETAQEAEIQMHVCRTKSDAIPVQQRCYSHWWLKERGYPSLLPPEMLPKADRFKPEIRPAVGIAVGTSKTWLKPALPSIMGAMVKEVENNAELITADPDLLRDKIQFARRDEFKRLFGAFDATEVER
jgi:hypothetical protein